MNASASLAASGRRHSFRVQRARDRVGAMSRDESLGGHSITSSAAASSVGGISRPSALAVFRLITSSNLVGFCTGFSDPTRSTARFHCRVKPVDICYTDSAGQSHPSAEVKLQVSRSLPLACSFAGSADRAYDFVASGWDAEDVGCCIGKSGRPGRRMRGSSSDGPPIQTWLLSRTARPGGLQFIRDRASL